MYWVDVAVGPHYWQIWSTQWDLLTYHWYCHLVGIVFLLIAQQI